MLMVTMLSNEADIVLTTVHCQVVDVSASVHELYCRLDPVSLQALVSEVELTF